MVNKGLQPPQEILSKGQLCAETSAEVDTNTNNAAPGVGMKVTLPQTFECQILPLGLFVLGFWT